MKALASRGQGKGTLTRQTYNGENSKRKKKLIGRIIKFVGFRQPWGSGIEENEEHVGSTV